MKKNVVLFIGALTSTSVLTGCGRQSSSSESVDSTKAQLTINTFDGGIGDKWLKNAARRFEEANAERTDFEEGRVGVQIHVGKARYADMTTQDLNDDIYFQEGFDYYIMGNNNKFADITDVLTTPNPNDNNKTILDKIDVNLRNYMNRDGKYYAVPFYDGIYGLVYNKSLFEEKEFYLKNDGTRTGDPSEFGTGPNGVQGDWDDGLPKTYEEFGQMMTWMRNDGITPFVYSSDKDMSNYTHRMLDSFWSDDEGYDQINLNYTLSGTANNIVSGFEGDTPITNSVDISVSNGYELSKQLGLYNALRFARNYLVGNNSDNFDSGASVDIAQQKFIGRKGIVNCAMLVEGTWWENEARSTIESAKKYGDTNYGLMAIPKSDASKVGEDATFMNVNRSYGFINKASKHMKLAKEFFAFLHTDAELEAFTKETNMTRALEYTVSDSVKSTLSTYARDLVAIKESEHVKIFSPYSSHKFEIDNTGFFSIETYPWKTNSYSSNPVTKFIDDMSLSARTYFEDHASYVTNYWPQQ